MTRGSILEYTEAVRGRYHMADRKGKSRILDEFIQVTGYHRKAAVRLLHRDGSLRPGKRRGRPSRYGPEVVHPLRTAWEATDRLCSKRLQPFLPELIRVMRRHGSLMVTLPKSWLRFYRLGAGDKVLLISNGEIRVKPKPKANKVAGASQIASHQGGGEQ